MTAKKVLAPEQLAQARHLYEQTVVPVVQIAAMFSVSDRWFYQRIRDENWRRRQSKQRSFHFARALSEAAAKLPPGGGELPPPPPLDPERLANTRLALAARLQDAVDAHLQAVKRVLAVVTPTDHGEAELCSRTLANVAEALSEVAFLTRPPEDEMTPHADADADDDDDIVPRDVDEFRRELTRRIRGFIEARRNGAAELPFRPEGHLD